MKRLFKILYDIFPVLNRPMALCALLSCGATYFMYRNSGVSLSLLALFAILSVGLCVLSRNRKLIIVLIMFLLVCASAVNEFATVRELESLDGIDANSDFVAVEDSAASGIVSHVTAYAYNSSVLPENTKLELHYYFKTEIKCGEKFNADVKLTKLKDNVYKSNKFGNSVYIDCKIKKINGFHGNEFFFTAIGNVRNYIKQTIRENFSKDDADFLIALNTGDRSYLDDSFYAKVRTCGVSHILVVSGLHISIILGSVFYLLEKFFYNKYLKAFVSLLLIFLLCAVCGFTLSVLRAGCMFVFSALSPVFLRKNDSLNSLGSSVLLLVFISPLCILSVGFWLSVLATAAVVWIAPFYGKLIIDGLKIENAILKNIILVVTVSFAAMLFTAPVSLAVFGYVSLLSPITFLLLTYPVTLALIINTFALMLSAAGDLYYASLPLFFAAGICAKYIRFIIEFLGRFEFMCVDLEVWSFMLFVFLPLVTVAAMYLYKFYHKLLKRNYLREVRDSAGIRGKRLKTNPPKG